LLEDVLKIKRVVMQLYEDNIVFVLTFGRESVNQSVLKICGRKTGETLKRKFLRNKLKSTEATKISSQRRGRKRAIFKHLWIFFRERSDK
jgi:transcriptional regulator of heat shock response